MREVDVALGDVAVVPDVAFDAALIGPQHPARAGHLTFDWELFKQIPLREQRSLQFRTGFFSLFNHVRSSRRVNGSDGCDGSVRMKNIAHARI